MRIVLTFLKGCVLSDAHFVENAFDKKTNNDFDINGIPEENDMIWNNNRSSGYIKKKKKKSLYTRLWRNLTITSSIRSSKREHNVDMEYQYLFTKHINKV